MIRSETTIGNKGHGILQFHASSGDVYNPMKEGKNHKPVGANSCDLVKGKRVRMVTYINGWVTMRGTFCVMNNDATDDGHNKGKHMNCASKHGGSERKRGGFGD